MDELKGSFTDNENITDDGADGYKGNISGLDSDNKINNKINNNSKNKDDSKIINIKINNDNDNDNESISGQDQEDNEYVIDMDDLAYESGSLKEVPANNSKDEDEVRADQTSKTADIGEDEAEALKNKYSELWDRYLRLQADFDNYRKREAKKRQDDFRYKHEDLLRDFLPILDNFKKAFKMKPDINDEKNRQFYDGFRMIYESILLLLENYGVRMMDVVGKPFDPNYHDAVAREENDEYPENTVVSEVAPGYMYRDRVLIHPKVTVSMSKK